MTTYDAHRYASDFLGWRGEVMARVRDILSRKAVPSPERILEKLSRLVHRLESAVPTAQLRSGVRDLLGALWREPPAAVEDALERELESLHARIRAYRSRESIENYCEFLFPLD
jgi:hypothetical protein